MPEKPNKFKSIALERGTWKEKQIAIFVESLNDREIVRELKYQARPVMPDGYQDLYQAYLQIKGDDQAKSKAWKLILEKYSGYVKAVREVEARNRSNEHYLREMLSVFEREQMSPYTMQVRQMLSHYEH